MRKRAGSRHLSVDTALEAAARDLATGDHANALLLLEKAVRLAPFNARARYLLGESQARAGNLNEALLNFEKAVEAAPKNADYRASLARTLLPANPNNAIPHFRAAIQFGSASPDVFCKLGLILVDLRREDEALEVYDHGLNVCQDQVDILANRASALFLLGRYDEAVTCCRRAVQFAPQNGTAHFNLGLALLLGGQYREGFREYEWRWRSDAAKKRCRSFDRPLWDGGSLREKRVLLHAEQGAGDTIQFARYLPLVARLGGRILLEVAQSLVRLMSCIPGQHRVLQAGSPVGDFDVHCPLLTLPLMCETDLDSIPPAASFVIPSNIEANWAQRIAGHKPKVALVWAGSPTNTNDRNRSLPLRSLLPLIGLNSVEFFSFQVGPPAAQLESEGVSARVRDLSPFLTDYTETAAALSRMDLVISADTSVAHLAASLGKLVWLLVPFVPDWRWLLNRGDSPWYPSMRLFRQKVRADWDTVVLEIVVELQRWLQKTNVGVAPAFIRGPTDLARWSDSHNLKESWNPRAKLAADFIPAGATVLDLGCGAMALETFLPYGSTYLPCDLVKRDGRTIVCNFNEESLPSKSDATHVVTLGVLEYIHDWQGFLRQLCAFRVPVIFSYHPIDYTQQMDRAALGWVNHIPLEHLCSEVYSSGFLVQNSMRIDNQVLLCIQPGQRRALGNPRALVLTYNNCGNFGDRLGFHLINSLLPGVAEIHHANFRPWNLPPGDFDLVVVGAGNSMFEPILTEELLSLVRRTPHSVGIFGTQYREEMNTARFGQLLDALNVWFARSEEDMLLYGKGRPNAIHLGDWLIDAFPMTCWTRNETLKVGKEIWNDLPLDRTIQQIQKYRNVFSERIHPFLCALTSAERVAYIEQRGGSGRPSGKFRGMLMDIFGRTWPESCLFEFRRECVADYRAKVQRIMAGMPKLFEEMLSSRG